eukprot:sb/3466603/
MVGEEEFGEEIFEEKSTDPPPPPAAEDEDYDSELSFDSIPETPTTDLSHALDDFEEEDIPLLTDEEEIEGGENLSPPVDSRSGPRRAAAERAGEVLDRMVEEEKENWEDYRGKNRRKRVRRDNEEGEDGVMKRYKEEPYHVERAPRVMVGEEEFGEEIFEEKSTDPPPPPAAEDEDYDSELSFDSIPETPTTDLSHALDDFEEEDIPLLTDEEEIEGGENLSPPVDSRSGPRRAAAERAGEVLDRMVEEEKENWEDYRGKNRRKRVRRDNEEGEDGVMKRYKEEPYHVERGTSILFMFCSMSRDKSEGTKVISVLALVGVGAGIKSLSHLVN